VALTWVFTLTRQYQGETIFYKARMLGNTAYNVLFTEIKKEIITSVNTMRIEHDSSEIVFEESVSLILS